MLLKDVMGLDGHIFLKSEWSPITNHWPTVSFTKLAVGERLQQEFDPYRDIILYVGTCNPKSTGDRCHRQRLLSAVKIDPSEILETSSEVPRASWRDNVRRYGNRWQWSLRVVGSWNIVDFPRARDVIPDSYRLLGIRKNMGNVVEVLEADRAALIELHVESVVLSNQPFENVLDRGRVSVPDHEIAISREIWRMTAAVKERVRLSGTQTAKVNPVRHMDSDLYEILKKKWHQQNGLCRLCGGALVISSTNKLLRASPDRIESQTSTYDDKNAQITHLGCNLAKNDVTIDEFTEWLAIVRGVRKAMKVAVGNSR